MSNLTALKSIIENLKSDKVKQRQDALVALREAFSQDRVLASLQYNEEGNRLPKHWLAIFQALFSTVQIEKKASTQRTKSGPSTAASLRRLSEAASTVRWLIERTVQFMTKTIARVVFSHLISMLPSRPTADAELFTPVALDYAKALKCLVSYTPHLEHLDDDMWISIVQMSFNVILDEPIQSRFAGKYVGAEDEDEARQVDSDMYEDDSEEMDEDMDGTDSDNLSSLATANDKKRRRTPAATPSTSKKRPRTHSPPTPIQSPRNAPGIYRTPVSLEQVEFASLLSIMIGSPIAPILRFSNLPSAILQRLEQFLQRYPSDSSLLHDFLSILSSTLSHISLNKKFEVAKFSRSAWSALVGLWGTKDKSIKAGIIDILRQLLPFTMCPVEIKRSKLPQFDCAKEFGRLKDLLAGETENRWGIAGLSLDALRLQNIGFDEEDKQSNEIFVAKTFRAGWNFDADQALSWAVLELYANCVGQLYQFSESMDSTYGTGLSRTGIKRKPVDPVLSILNLIHSVTLPTTRCYHLQTLLFVIDHYWSTLHSKLKEQIVDTLLQNVVAEHAVVQSWVFLNFTAVIQAEGSLARRLMPTTIDIMKWDSIWTHAVRRVNVPAICRAACHAGYTILFSHPYISKSSTASLSSHRILSEIETLTKDMDIQGPPYPFDSVCRFLSQCLLIASQDSRLYRMHLEDKIASWLVDAWEITGNKMKMPTNTVADILFLLETICGLSKRSGLVVQPLIPQSQITDTILKENKVRVVQDYVLHAKLPPFVLNNDPVPNLLSAKSFSTHNNHPSDSSQLAVSNVRARKMSSFLLHSLEALIERWNATKDSGIHPTIETTRQSIDIAIIGIIFETLLSLNGTPSNRQVVQSSAKLLSALVVLINDTRWSITERLLLAHSLEILTGNDHTIQVDDFHGPLGVPGGHSGIKAQVLLKLLHSHHSGPAEDTRESHHVLRMIWQNVDLQDALDLATSTLRATMSELLLGKSVSSNGFGKDQEDHDGFGSIRTAHQSSTLDGGESSDRPIEHIFRICIGVLSYGPFLQSLSAEANQDKDLARSILEGANTRPERFVVICPIYLNALRQGILHLSTKQLSDFFDVFGNLLRRYPFSRNERFHRLVIYLLMSSIGKWEGKDPMNQKVRSQFRDLSSWLCRTFVVDENKKVPLGFRSWILRDAFAQFLDEYLLVDSDEKFWPGQNAQEFPTSMLLAMNTDHDTRVRFRVATIMSNLSSERGTDTYGRIADSLPIDLDAFEHILTRLLALGNIMIVNSALRGGSYWHLLEASLYHEAYSTHIESILMGVSTRLGISPFSALFEAYMTQIVHCVNATDKDFMHFPPQILGYHDRKQFSEATFRVLAPTHILHDRIEEFGRHCKMVQKPLSKGVEDCFGEIVGFWILESLGNIPQHLDPLAELDAFIQGKLSDTSNFKSLCEENMDGIVIQLFRSLGDQDCSDNGPMASALQQHDDGNRSMRTFVRANIFRRFDTFSTHPPNRPMYHTQTVLDGLALLKKTYPSAFSVATTYHVIQGLMNEIHRTPLVNEQLRLVNALTLWLAIQHQDMQDVIIHQVILQGATLLISQWDLARSAQSLLDLVFRHYKNVNVKDARFSNAFIRICSIAHDYVTNAHDTAISKLGQDLQSWVDEQALEMSKASTTDNAIMRALPAWPRLPSSELLPLFDQTSLQSLISVLEDHQITSNKFRIVRRFKEQTERYGYDNDDEFANTYFWRFKDCMPLPEMLQEQDLESFADLIFLHHGHIQSFDVELHNLNKARTRHVRNLKSKPTPNESKIDPARDAITLALLIMLEDEKPVNVYNAYSTLRFIAAVSSTPSQELGLSHENRTALKLFKVHRRSPLTLQVVPMADLLKSDAYIEAATNFPRWISLMTILLSNNLSKINLFYGQLSSILTSDTNFAEEVFPILVFTLLHSDRDGVQSFKKILSEYFSLILLSGSTDNACLRAIVDVVLHLRYFLPYPTDRLSYNHWLEIDFTLLAKSAISCGAYTTALLFVELAAEEGAKTLQENNIVENVLYDIYAHIDEPDGFYGIKTQDLHQFLIRRFHHEHQWDKAFRFHGATLEAGINANLGQQGLIDSFHSFGFDHLAVDTLQKITDDFSSDSKLSAINFELGWRTENWDLPDQSHAPRSPLYRALRAIHRERDPIAVEDIIKASLRQEVGRLRSLGSENLTEIRAVSRDLMSLSQIKEWWKTIGQELRPDDVPKEWHNLADMDTRFEFADLEQIMATRISLVRSVRKKEERRQIGTLISPSVRSLRDVEKRCLIRLSEAARSSGKIQIALNSIVKAQKLDSMPTSNVSAEFAHVLWVHKEEKMAVQYLKNVVEVTTAGDTSWDLEQKALWLSSLGTWTSEAYLAKPTEIWDQYFFPAVDLLEQLRELQQPITEASQATVYRECAMFAERQYHTTLKSPDALRWKVYVDRKKREIEDRSQEMATIPEGTVRYKELTREQANANKILSEDSELFNRHNTLRESFLKQAIEMHSRCLGVSSGYDNDSAVRFCSLWFANFDDLSILEAVRQGIERIPSHKLVFLAHQLTARVAHSSVTTLPPAQQNLQDLVLRMCREHPFHSLYQVYCSADHIPPDFNRRQSGRGSSQTTQSTQTERGAAASNILNRLRDDPITGQRVRDVEQICDAIVEWAVFPISKKDAYKNKASYDVPSAMKILRIQNMKVPVSTARIPVDPSMKYDNCAWLKCYSRTFSTAGGVNLPKICKCQDMEGRAYKQLFKGEGKDDLRQDAVMEQVFDLVNSLLKQDRETRRRHLQVRDYKVIPLNSTAGLLEFVGNTTTLRDWLGAAHIKYRPQDEKPQIVADKIRKYQALYAHRPDKQRDAYEHVKKNFKPVFRHYFTENHKNPISWFKMRLRYTRSVATTSIVGHVLGLGDRHVSNILIDNGTGDVVHIDLGIAFDQGRRLPIPERVPFRMTADIIDGMGISGTSGVFQRCAEETLRVLRDESGVIMTVLEVFKHDPLHTWTASETKVMQAQSEAPIAAPIVQDAARFNMGIGIDINSGSAEEAADRALSSVARKLDKSLSVESTVNELVAEATDLQNLATIYHGWSPHL
ncbi:Serine/threonine-protein kinase TEL1 [Psilocybe cubensis]|uniref:Serine/threonine-protein kinase Tel1 n=2 Tax=Psilocybe cubensis TaxID=181762 RepID=A0A8H8CI63_PSICU|nr:Serine/threonine-protein kinase TEL1 [Psilocybe cubensis]KAH9479387.1 Serine/threonine-protein kinase TEL1 [Psilocybe cubensis]